MAQKRASRVCLCAETRWLLTQCFSLQGNPTRLSPPGTQGPVGDGISGLAQALRRANMLLFPPAGFRSHGAARWLRGDTTSPRSQPPGPGRWDSEDAFHGCFHLVEVSAVLRLLFLPSLVTSPLGGSRLQPAPSFLPLPFCWQHWSFPAPGEWPWLLVRLGLAVSQSQPSSRDLIASAPAI